MKDSSETNQELIADISVLKKRIHELENSEAERKRVEEALQLSRERLEDAQRIARIGDWEADLFTGELYWSQVIFDIFGLDSKSFKPSVKAFYQAVHPNDRGLVLESEKHSEQTGLHDVIHRIIRPDGEVRVIHELARRYIDEKGELVMLRGTVQDITDRKRAEEELKRTNTFLDSIIENIPNMVFIKDGKDLRFVRVNRAGEELLGYSRNDLLGKSDYDFFPKEQADRFTEKDRNVLHGKKVMDISEEPIQTRNKGERILHTKKVPILNENGAPEYLLGISEDISERKQTEDALRASEDRFHAMFEQAGDGVFILDTNGKIISVNETFAIMHGFTQEELLSKGLEGLDVEGSSPVPDRLRRIMCGETLSFEVEHYHKDGHTFPLSVTANLISPGNEQLIIAVHRDISERKQAEKILLESEQKYRVLFETANDGIFLQGKTGFVDCNEKGASMYGLPRDEVIGRSPAELCPERQPDGRLSVEVATRKTMAALNGEPQNFEWRALRADRVPLDVEITLNRVEMGDSLLLAIVRDITERKRAEEEKRILEERLQRAEKMEALGQLAGGVAHDLNNVLGVLSGYSELLIEKIPTDNPIRKYAENIFKSTEKGAAIIQDLLTLARRGVVVSQVVDMNGIVSNFLSTMEFDRLREYHPGVTFRSELEKDILNIKGSPVHLEKTVMNLVSNAAEAIVGSGEVMIRTENRYLDKAVRGYDQVNEGDYVVLSVSDTGGGIPAAESKKIFEPFYTKKKMGRSGTGLGLAIVWGAVKDHEGYIDVQSAEGKGTTLTLYFPVTREEMADEAKKIPVDEYIGHGESVLVVDDVERQRMVATALLMELGYQIHTVSSGEEAVDYLKSNEADIMVLDMIMEPGIDGLETYKQILEINPKQKAIIVSGFSETDRVREAQRMGAGAYVKKPYVTQKIGLAIRNELNRK